MWLGEKKGGKHMGSAIFKRTRNELCFLGGGGGISNSSSSVTQDRENTKGPQAPHSAAKTGLGERLTL